MSGQGARETSQLVAPHGLRQKSHSWPCLGEGSSAISKFWALSAREIPQIASCGTGHEGNSTTSGLSAQSVRKTLQLPAVRLMAEEIRQLASFSMKGSKNRWFRGMGSWTAGYLLQTLGAAWWLWPMAVSLLCFWFMFAVTAVCSNCQPGESSRRLQHFGFSLWQFTLAE